MLVLRVIFESVYLKICVGLTNSMEHSWEANSHSVGQEILRLLWNPKAHYRVHKSPSLDPVLGQIYPVHTFTPPPISLRSFLILASHLRLGLPSSLRFFRSGGKY
jgi:hypothetical protein